MPEFPKKLSQKLEKRHEDDAFRKLSSPNALVDFSSNDYLGLSRALLLKSNTTKILESANFNNSATGSRLLTGNHSLYGELETFLNSFYGFESSLVFNSGYDANIGFFSSVPQRGDLIFYDELVHASIRDGIKMGNAKAYKFKHNSFDSLKNQIEQSQNQDFQEDIYVVTESVFSMDGDSPALMELADFCKQNKLYLIIDEAHAVGVFDKGLVVENNLQEMVFAQIITFGKALGCHGAAILGSKQLKDYLLNFARSFIYTTALPPHTVASILAGHQSLNTEYGQSLIEKLRMNISYFKSMVQKMKIGNLFLPSDSAIQIAMVEGNTNVKGLSSKLRENGFDIRAIVSPTVSKGNERLRICLHSFNRKEDIENILLLIKENG